MLLLIWPVTSEIHKVGKLKPHTKETWRIYPVLWWCFCQMLFLSPESPESFSCLRYDQEKVFAQNPAVLQGIEGVAKTIRFRRWFESEKCSTTRVFEGQQAKGLNFTAHWTYGLEIAAFSLVLTFSGWCPIFVWWFDDSLPWWNPMWGMYHSKVQRNWVYFYRLSYPCGPTKNSRA